MHVTDSELRQRGATCSGRSAKVESEDLNPGTVAPGLRHRVSTIKLFNNHRAKCEIIGMGQPPKEGGQLSELQKPKPGLGEGFFGQRMREGCRTGLAEWGGMRKMRTLSTGFLKIFVFILRTTRSPWQV